MIVDKTYMSTNKARFNSLFLVTFIGFFSGFPLLLTSSTMQAWAVDRGLSFVEIGSLSFLSLPYLLKWLWAPIVDKWHYGQGAGRKFWMICSQLGIVVFLITMAYGDDSLVLWQFAALLVAFFSATQDLAIDAYKIELLAKSDYGLGSAVSCVGYRLAMMLSGGGLLIVADFFGWRICYLIAAGIVLIFILLSMFFPEKPLVKERQSFVSKAAWLDLLSRNKACFWLLLILLYRFADVVLVNFGGAFLLKHCGLSLTQVGIVYKIVGVGATIVGSVVAGLLLKKNTFNKLLLIGAVLQSLSFIPFVVASVVIVDFVAINFIVGLESFVSGFAVTCLLALIMDWCNESYLATQMAWLTAIVAIPRVLFGGVVGSIIDYFGWFNLFVWLLALSLLVVTFIVWLIRG